MDALFVAQTADATCYHRIMLPALALGCDWCGLDAPPPQSLVGRGGVRAAGDRPDFGSYEALVVSTPTQDGWLDLIPQLQAGGTRVFCELDYDLHAFEQPPEAFQVIGAAVEMCDGVICANDRIAERYGAMNANTHVCESGIDLQAYALTRPEHDTVNIGWLGRSLSHDDMRTWLARVTAVMQARPATNFITLGVPYADLVADSGAVAPERCLTLPLVLPEQLPAAMSLFDICFDPLGKAPWRRARSALRWLEAAAWGIPFVGDPRVHRALEHGVTGFHARTPDALAQILVALVDDQEMRAEVGRNARRVLEERYAMPVVAQQWRTALAGVEARP
jgi:glycosyltransferase involved in cell wall biosynthesis